MSCRLRYSTNEAEFAAEMMIHFGGRKHLENPGVRALPRISVGLDCGSTQFTIPETELGLLQRRQRAIHVGGMQAARSSKAG